MKGENDDILAWPWQGNITIEMVHQSRDIPRYIHYSVRLIIYES